MKYSDFNNKKIIIVVPHEDDEICLTGGLLSSLENNNNVKVIYVTNGNFTYNQNVRYKEAINSCKILGVKKENIIFLGYSDCPYDQDSHMYTTNGIWIDKFHCNLTSGIKNIDEYCFSRYGIHHEFTIENLIADIKDCIQNFMPDIVIGIDLDFHPDHIMTSLCLEKALGEIFKENLDYHPIVLKGFAYENAYLGPADFNDKNVKEMYFKYDENGNLSNNKYYSNDNEINIDLKPRAYTRNLFTNRLYKAILKHKSQVLVAKSFSLINPNVKYWIRNSNNLINKASINVSSGNKDFLNDFKLCDSTDILNGNVKNIIYDSGIWIPDKNDDLKEINILFKNFTYVYKLKLYNGNNNEKYIQNLLLCIDGIEYRINNDKLIIDFIIDKKIKNIKIRILDELIENGFSEIELLNCESKRKNSSNIIKSDEYYSIKINNIINIINIFFTKIYRKIFLKKNYK